MTNLSVTATEAMAVAADGVISTDERGTILFCNPAAAAMFGYSQDDMLGRSLDLLLPERFRMGHDVLVARFAAGEGEPRRMMATRREVYGRRRSGEEFPMEISLARSHPDGGMLLTAVLRDVSERKELERELADKGRALEESEARMRLALQSGKLGVWEWNLETDEIALDDRSRKTLNLPGQGSITGEQLFGRVHPDDLPCVREQISDAIENAGELEIEFRLLDADGTQRLISARAMVRQGEPGRPAILVGVNSDVTRRWRAEQDRELLTSELHHRLQNVIAVARSLVSLSAAGSETAKELESAVQTRLAGLSERHRLLLREGWRDAGLDTLISGELRPYAAPGGGNLELQGPEVRITPRAATALGMALHELATNAAKYGALCDPDGKLTVRWKLTGGDDQDRQLEIEWQERAKSQEPRPERTGFGTRLIDGTIRRQLGGSIERSLRDEGLLCTMAIPLERLQETV